MSSARRALRANSRFCRDGRSTMLPRSICKVQRHWLERLPDLYRPCASSLHFFCFLSVVGDMSILSPQFSDDADRFTPPESGCTVETVVNSDLVCKFRIARSWVARLAWTPHGDFAALVQRRPDESFIRLSINRCVAECVSSPADQLGAILVSVGAWQLGLRCDFSSVLPLIGFHGAQGGARFAVGQQGYGDVWASTPVGKASARWCFRSSKMVEVALRRGDLCAGLLLDQRVHCVVGGVVRGVAVTYRGSNDSHFLSVGWKTAFGRCFVDVGHQKAFKWGIRFQVQ